MPIYPYRCEACGKTTEVWAKMDDPAPEQCPHCGKGPLSRTVARTAFHLKGGGWYAQGYGSGGGKGKAGDGGGKSEGGGESKSSGTASSSSTSSSTSTDSSASTSTTKNSGSEST